MKALALLLLAVIGLASSFDFEIQNGRIGNPFATKPTHFKTANCQCTCDCQATTKSECNLDLYVVLDSAVCVKNIWDEMKFRVNRMLKDIDDFYPIGTSARITVLTYAKSVNVDIDMINQQADIGMNYAQLTAAIDKLEWMNQGSYLNNAVEALEKQMDHDQWSASGRKRAVLLVTNGKSHTTVSNAEVASTLRRIRNDGEIEIYFNTLVPVKAEADYANCKVCDFNRVLLTDMMDMVIRKEDVEMDDAEKADRYGSVISKTKLTKLFRRDMQNWCSAPVKGACRDCACKCVAPEGPQGPAGLPGIDGPNGCNGCNGAPGAPGKDGRVGVDGPNGVDGYEGRPGSPGQHGFNGPEGPKGLPGNSGAVGVQGAPGNPGGCGVNGGQGLPGAVGVSGAQGDAGLPGRPGQAGLQGEPGYDGLSGPAGPNGQTGPKGPRGLPGVSGQDGVDGARGPAGACGNAGKRGETGAPGKQGHQGMQGPQGAAGRNGADGPVGPQGIAGNPGQVGNDGSIGHLPTEQQIRSRIRAYLKTLLNAQNKITRQTCYNFGSGQFSEVLTQLTNMPHYSYPVVGGASSSFKSASSSSGSAVWGVSTKKSASRSSSSSSGHSSSRSHIVKNTGSISNTDENLGQDFGAEAFVMKDTAPILNEFKLQNPKKYLDIIYFIEASENILAYHWTAITEWMQLVSSTAADLKINADSIAIVIRFKSYNSDQFKNFLNRKVDEMKHKTGFQVIVTYLTDDGQDSYDALEEVSESYAPELRYNAKKILISLTDGLYRTRSQKSAFQKATIMNKAHSAFDTMIAVGYGSNMNEREVSNWSTSYPGVDAPGTSFLLQDITQLEETVGAVADVFEATFQFN